MFDPHIYNSILNAANSVLQNNLRQVGNQFANEFMTYHDPQNGAGTQPSIERLTRYVTEEAQRRFGRNDINSQELHDIVTNYVEGMYQNWYAEQTQQPTFNRGYAPGPTAPFNQGGYQQRPMSTFFGGSGQQRSRAPSSFLSDTAAYDQPAAPQPAPPTPVPAVAPQETKIVTDYPENPLDAFPDGEMKFQKIDRPATWGTTDPADDRIMLFGVREYKTEKDLFLVRAYQGAHNLIMDSSLDVVKDFFTVVPDEILGQSFMFQLFYNHLDVIDVATADFLSIREQCVEAIRSSESTLIHKTVSRVFDTMNVGSYRELDRYLTRHINRALYLNCRVVDDLKNAPKLSEFRDVNDLLSSDFRGPVVAHPQARRKLEQIVGAAIWNALVMNTNSLFTPDGELPTAALQSSPAIPYSMAGVYPNKYAIPTRHDPDTKDFTQRLWDKELGRKTYLISRRSVVITNILGKKVLPNLTRQPKVFTNTVASLLRHYALPFSQYVVDLSDLNQGEVKPLVEEGYPADQLETYYQSDDHRPTEETIHRYSKTATPLPVDQTIFALPQGSKPDQGLYAIDILLPIVDGLNPDQVILASKHVPHIKTL